MSSEQQAGGESIFTLNHNEPSPLAEFEQVPSVDPWSYWVNAGDVVKRADYDRLLAYAKTLHESLEKTKTERDEAQRAKYGTPCKCESWMETCRLAEERAEGAESKLSSLHAAAVRLANDNVWWMGRDDNGRGRDFYGCKCGNKSLSKETITHTPGCPAGLVLGMDGGK